jgi:hypothetical protein
MVRGTQTAAAALVLLAACGSPQTGFGPGAGPGGDDAGDDDGPSMEPATPSVDAGDGGGKVVFNVGDAASTTTTSSGDCPASAKLVYVTGEGGDLYSFYPPTLKFTLVGTMTCLPTTPSHMTVDRTGTAWVVSNGDLYRASTTNAACSAVSNWVGTTTFPDFALTFLGTTSATDTTLYMLSGISFSGTGTLGTFDTATGAVKTVASVQVPSAAGDMTTNGDGSLYFLMDQTPLTLYEITPTTGAVAKSYPVNATVGGNAALAFWGGSFYAFESGVINQFDTATGVTTSLGNAPIRVTGAGQSTCVPTVPPGAQ